MSQETLGGGGGGDAYVCLSNNRKCTVNSVHIK
jgi:hypothetical protein